MFVHLNKKIAVPNCKCVRSVAWSWEHDYIACGGDNGILKIIKLQGQFNTNGSSSKNFSHNQTLESHKSNVKSVCWNEQFQKMTSSDDSGSIIVWMLYKGMWYEEMVNNRNKSLVSGMAWTRDGQKICIVYGDGAIITGSVEGNRIWGKDVKNIAFNQVEWSPDGRTILIGTSDFELHVYEESGNFLRKMQISKGAHDDETELIAIKWSNLSAFTSGDGSAAHSNVSTSSRRLLVAYDDGIVHLLRDDEDDYPANVRTELRLTAAEWNFVGDIFAVTGSKKEDGLSRNYLKLFDADGGVLQVIKVPGNDLSDCSWDRNGLRLALAVDSYLFFAHVRPAHHWALLDYSVVFALPDHYNARPENGTRLIFWEFTNNQKYERQIRSFCQLVAFQTSCAVVSKILRHTETIPSTQATTNATTLSVSFCLSLFNSCGALIDLHTVDNFPVRHCALNSTRLIVTSDDSVYIWHFGDSLLRVDGTRSARNEKLLSELTLDTEFERRSSSVPSGGRNSIGIKLISKNDPISCITASEKSFLLAHHSGVINQYGLPSAVLMHSIQPPATLMRSLEVNIPTSGRAAGPIRRLSLNQQSTRLAMIDQNRCLHCYDFEANNEAENREGKWLESVKFQDVWDMKWSTDNNDYLAVYEKNRIIVVDTSLRTGNDAEPFTIITNGYLGSLEKFVLKCVNLDALIVDTVNEIVEDVPTYVEKFETDPLLTLRRLLAESIPEAFSYASRYLNQSSLWNTIIEHCLLELELEHAHSAMVKCRDYRGIQFLKRLQKISDSPSGALRRAEVCSYLARFDDAEKLYRELNRPDLLVEMYERVGAFGKMFDTLESFPVVDYDKAIKRCHMNMGVDYAARLQWSRATRHFEKTTAPDQLVSCFIYTGNYNALINLIDSITDRRLLSDIALYLESIGMVRDAARSFIRANRIEQAVKVCERMSEWKTAIDLASKYQIANVDTILDKYVEHLTTKNKFFEIVEVYRKARRIGDAMAIVMKLVAELRRANVSNGNTILFKKLFVLIGLLHEENKAEKQDSSGGANTRRAKATLNELLETDKMFTGGSNQDTNKAIDDPWKGAEAYHFLLLTQQHLYKSNYDLALKCAMQLLEYDEFLPPEEVYCLLALSSYHCKIFTICSKAFIKLESLNDRAANKRASVNGFDNFWLEELKPVIPAAASATPADPADQSSKQLSNSSSCFETVYEQMAMAIFEKNSPAESRNQDRITLVNCKFCSKSIPDYSTQCQYCRTKFLPCIATGRPIMDSVKQWTCSRCEHHAIKAEVKLMYSCPLCHLRISNL